MLALNAFEAESCSGCGHHPSITSDPSNVFMPTTEVCPVCAGVDRFLRIQAAQDKAIEDQISDTAPPQTARPGDGRRTYLRPLSPDEVAEETAKRKGA